MAALGVSISGHRDQEGSLTILLRQLFPNAPGELKTVHSGKCQIKEHDIRETGPDCVKPSGGRSDSERLEAPVAEQQSHAVGRNRLVFDHEPGKRISIGLKGWSVWLFMRPACPRFGYHFFPCRKDGESSQPWFNAPPGKAP